MPVALITGITGQDGGYLAEQLVSGGWSVHGTVRPGETVPEHVKALERVVLHDLDFIDTAAVARLVREVEPDEVYNLAGISSVAVSWADPVLTAQVNGVAVVALLSCLQEQQERTGRLSRLLQASSAEVFAGAGLVPQDEQTPIVPRSPYGASKALAHHHVQLYRAAGLHAVNVVLYNHESPRRPPSFVTRKITQTVAAIADGRADRLVLGNLESRRDWGWAPEYVEAMVRALRHDTAEDFVVATGVGHSVADFVAAAFAWVGIEDWRRYVETDRSLTRVGDPVELVGNAEKARRLLGWAPVTAFDEVVGRMVDADRDGG